jgi:hypothetical protein
MRVTSESSVLRRWHWWIGALIVAEIGWFLLLRHEVGPAFHGRLRLAMPPLAVIGYVYLLGAVSVYLDNRDWDYRMRQLIVIMLGLSVGLFVFALMTVTTAQLEGEAG